MKSPAVSDTQCFLLPRICDTARLRFDGKCAPVSPTCPLEPGTCFMSGALNGLPTLDTLRIEPSHHGCGSLLHARLHLPVMLCFACGCEHIVRTGTLCVDFQAMLRTPPVQIVPQAELCIRSVFLQDGCMCAEFDLRLCLYAVQLQPVQLPAPCPAPPQPDCAPYFHLPLYPQLPHQCTHKP